MKKLLYIFMCLSLMTACIKENFSSPVEVTEGEMVTIDLSVSVPEMEAATRALGEYNYADGSHPTLWVVVFDQQGYLVEYAKATEQSYNGGANKETKFSVELHATPEPCILHYILNYADELELDYGHENTVIGSMSVTGNQDVYWQRRVLTGGISNDSKYVSDNFTKIPLVRNFAKITVTENLDNFELTGFYVLNCPQSGTVAPYYNGAFVNYQPTLASGQTLYNALTAAGYVGTMPDGVEYGNTAAPAAAAFTTSAKYLYENTYSKDGTVPTVLIKGRYGNDSNDTYYKADLLTNDMVTGGQTYAHILRNFQYNLNIKSVVASGKASVQEAMAAAANNNLSGAVEIRELTNITNGQVGLYVSFTDTTLVSTDPIVLKYRFYTDIANKTIDNSRVTVSAPAGNVVKTAVTGSDISATGSSWNGWRELTITPQALPESTQEQTIVLYDATSKLRREVVLTLRRKLNMNVACNPARVANTPGAQMTLNICFDANLNKGLFPLEFTIESQASGASTLKQYISPAKDEAMSVKLGSSIIPGFTTQKSYQYIKTLSYDVYKTLTKNAQGQVIFPVQFVTNIGESASTVYVRNQYFEDDNSSFTNFSAKYFTNLAFPNGVKAQAGSATVFTFNMTSVSPVNVTLTGLTNSEGKSTFVYTPNATGTQTMNLLTVNASGTVKVELEADAYDYARASLSAEQANKITIASATLSFTWNYQYAQAGPSGVESITVEGGSVTYGGVSFGGSNKNRSITLTNLVFEGSSLTDESKVVITVYRDGMGGSYSQQIETTIGALKGN